MHLLLHSSIYLSPNIAPASSASGLSGSGGGQSYLLIAIIVAVVAGVIVLIVVVVLFKRGVFRNVCASIKGAYIYIYMYKGLYM